MPVPNVPFWASSAKAEFGGPWLSTAMANAGVYPGFASALGGRSAYTAVHSGAITPSYADTSALFTPNANTSFTASAAGGTGSYSYSWFLSSASGSGSASSTGGSTATLASGVNGVGSNADLTLVWGCTISDGITSTTVYCTHYHFNNSNI